MPTKTPRPPDLTGVSLFCAFGSIGLRPDPLPPDYDAEYVVAVIDVDNEGDPVTGVAVTTLELRDHGGATRARMRRVQELGAFPATTAMQALDSSGSWAFYSDAPIPTFTGTLPHGHTRLRIRAWIDVFPGGADHVRLTLGNADHHVVIDGAITGSFPS